MTGTCSKVLLLLLSQERVRWGRGGGEMFNGTAAALILPRRASLKKAASQ